MQDLRKWESNEVNHQWISALSLRLMPFLIKGLRIGAWITSHFSLNIRFLYVVKSSLRSLILLHHSIPFPPYFGIFLLLPIFHRDLFYRLSIVIFRSSRNYERNREEKWKKRKENLEKKKRRLSYEIKLLLSIFPYWKFFSRWIERFFLNISNCKIKKKNVLISDFERIL